MLVGLACHVSAGCSLMCIGECQFVALDHDLVGLWFLTLHCSFLLYIEGYAGGMLVGCVWWCASGFPFFGVSYGCGLWLFTGPPSTLDYVFYTIYLVLSS